MEGKKISFGFKKTKKLEKLPVQEKVDFIECVEEKSIKIVGGEEINEIVPLVIPMKPNTLLTTERLKEIAEKVESALEEPETVEATKSQETVPENETLDQMAVRELLEDSKKVVEVDTPQLTLLLPAKSVASGEKESTLGDYESVPVQEFGLAMLRGMGWTKTNDKSAFKPPQLRPKGLGLGADKVVKDKQKVSKNSKDEELTIVKNAFVKITTGKFSGYYGKVLSLDEDNGRVMVDISVKNETVSLSEFMMHPVPKSEFDKESKVINANSFEQYKKNEGEATSKNSDKESSSRGQKTNRNKDPKHERDGNDHSKDNNNLKWSENEKQNDNRDRSERNRDRSNRERHRDNNEKYRKNYRGSSQDSLSDSDSGRKYIKERKTKKQYSSMESLNSDTEKRNKKRETDRSKKSDKEQKRRDSDDLGGNKNERRTHESNIESDKNRKKIEKDQKYSSDSESEHRSSKKSGKERRTKRSGTPEEKRDIDKKRKGKKKKRDRDRSPNHRKHRK